MKLLDTRIWNQQKRRILDPDEAVRILRDSDFTTTDFQPYLDVLKERHGLDLPHFRSFIQFSFIFQSGSKHLSLRRAIAPFFAPSSVERLVPLIDKSIATTINHLRSAPNADLFSDYCEPIALPVLRRFIGLPGGDAAAVLPLIRLSHEAFQPMRSIQKLLKIDSALGELAACLAPTGKDSDTLIGHMRKITGDDKLARGVALSSLIAAHALAHTPALVIFDTLLSRREEWRAIAKGDLSDADLNRLLSTHVSSKTLVRVAQKDRVVGTCPYSAGEAVVLDIAKVNTALRNRNIDSAGLSFGAGAHKCPGEPLVRLVVRRALPELARAFPDASLHRNGVRHYTSPLQQYPCALPAELGGRNRRISSRMVEILQTDTARTIVNDNRNWGPPPLDTHLIAVQERTGTDLGPAIRIARNAMFFMSGPRHATARRHVAAVLGGNRISTWQPLIDDVVRDALDHFSASSRPDLISDFADPIFRGVMQPMLGVVPSNSVDFDASAPTLQDVLEPWLPMRALQELQKVFEDLLDQMQSPPTTSYGNASLLRHLLDSDLKGFDSEDCKALVLVLYGASFNLVHTLGNIVHQLLAVPNRRPRIETSPNALAAQVDRLIGASASPKYIYRVARNDGEIDDIIVQKGDTLRLQLLSINRDAGIGHLGFGHGLHRCVGAAVTRHIIRTALPALFDRFPDLSLVPGKERYHSLSQTVALSHLPCHPKN